MPEPLADDEPGEAPDGATLRGSLLAERAAAAARRSDLASGIAAMIAASEGANADDEHDPEGATIAFERAQAQALLDAAAARLAEIDRAVGRLDAGEFGVCTSCGRPIDPRRLAARPSADRCVDCATRSGRHR